jgi:two-component system, NarL family, nitrate/nitrite response regulator NarL
MSVLPQQQHFPTTTNHSKVTAAVICGNPIWHMGVRQMLTNSIFEVTNEDFKPDPSELVFIDNVPDLFIVEKVSDPIRMGQIVTVLKERYAKSRVVLLAEQFEIETLPDLIKAGVDGFCLTTMHPGILIQSLELTMLDFMTFSREMFAGMITLLTQRAADSVNTSPHRKAFQGRTETIAHRLSGREREILHCVMYGDTNKVIARKLEVTEATVKVHVKAILRKIGVANRTQAAMWATVNLAEDTLQIRPT